MVKLVGRKRATSFKYTFDSRGELFQRVTDLAMVDWCLSNQGFVVHQYDASGKLLAESGQTTPVKAQPVKVVKAGIGKNENWSMLELEVPEQPKTASEIEQEWLAEEIEAERQREAAEKRGEAPKTEQTEIGKVVDEAGEHPLMRHVFGDDWSDSDNNFKLQAAARKRGIDFDKSATRDELIEMLRASDRARAERGENGESE
jgi:hypothetical protein